MAEKADETSIPTVCLDALFHEALGDPRSLNDVLQHMESRAASDTNRQATLRMHIPSRAIPAL